MVTVTNDKDDEIFIGKITDITSTIIRLIISILKLLKINIPKSAESGIGLITLLIFIYWSADILKFDKSTHMLIFYAIFMIVIFEIIGYNSSKISKILSRENKVDSIIKEIIEGNITSDQAYSKIIKSNLNSENIDSLLIGLSDKKMLSEKIQNAIISSQYLNIKNINTLFNKNSTIFLTGDSMSKLLSLSEIKGTLNDEHIMKIYENYKNNPVVIARLMLYQSIAEKVLSQQIDENTKIEFESRKKYLDKPLFIDENFNSLNSILKGVFLIIYLLPLIYAIYNFFISNDKFPSETYFSIFIVVSICTMIFMNIYVNFVNFVSNRFNGYVVDKIKFKLGEYKNSG
jgi:hypothetical protein